MADRKKQAVAYIRTSSATNVGADKDSDKRQSVAIEAFAKSGGYEIAATFNDAAVSGTDHLTARPGFVDLLAYLDDNPEVTTIIVETANRFARDLIVAETGFTMLRDRGVDLIAADSPGQFLEDTPTATLIRQILGAVSEFEKAALVAKLKGARERKKAITGKCEGRKSHLEARPAVVAMAKRLRRRNPKTGRVRSLRKISAELAAAGYLNERGKPFAANSVKNMLEGPKL